MKTRRKPKTTNKVLTKKQPEQHINKNVTHPLVSQYLDLVIEFQTKQNRFKTELKECMKWKKQNSTFFTLQPRMFLTSNSIQKMQNPTIQIQKAMDELKHDLTKVNKEYAQVHAICEVESRSYYGLLQTRTSGEKVFYRK